MVTGRNATSPGGPAEQPGLPTRKQAPGDLFDSLHTLPYRKDAIMTTTFSLSFAALSIDGADPAVPADFRGKTLNRPVTPEAVARGVAVDATDPASGPRLLFHEVPEPETLKNRLTVPSGPSYPRGGS
jgi:hypothetical protein